MAPRYNYFQPIYFEYDEALIKDVTGYVMAFHNKEQFDLHYGTREQKAPTDSLLDTLRLLLPQIRVINNLTIFNKITKEYEPNPVAFLADEKINEETLSWIFRKWVEVWYPESSHEKVKKLCTPEQFQWNKATPEQLKWWSPGWRVAKLLSEQEYELGDNKFKLLFSPSRKGNTVELVSWPPLTDTKGYGHKASIGVVISTQSDLDHKRINIHLKMKRWVVKRGDKDEIGLQKKTTHCYIRKLQPWSREFNLFEPNAFTVLEAKNFKNEETQQFERQWKDTKILAILDKLGVKIHDIEDVLKKPSKYFESDNLDILIPARASQKVGFGTGFPISDTRKLLKQITSFLPKSITLTKPWRKISEIKDDNNTKQQFKQASELTKQKFLEQPKIQKPSKNQLPKLTEVLKEFLKQRANIITVYVCTSSNSKTKDAIKEVADHYFGDSLNLKFIPWDNIANPITFTQSNRKNSPNRKIPELKHIKEFGDKYKQDHPTPIIVEIFSQDHPSYKGNADPKSYIKSMLPKYNLIPQCIVLSENNVLNRAFSALLDAIMPFDQKYPLSTSEDNNVYAGFYVISRNKATSNDPFYEPVLVVIYQNEIKVLLLENEEIKWFSFPDAVCYLSNKKKNRKKQDESIVKKILDQLSLNYSNADNIYLYAHTQKSRQYWPWLKEKDFDPSKSPTNKITIIRIRDLEDNEVASGYGLPIANEDFSENFDPEIASYANGIFMPLNSKPGEIPFIRSTLHQTVLSIAQKPETLKTQPKNKSRVEPWTSQGYEKEENAKGEKVDKLDTETGKRIKTTVNRDPDPYKDWKMPQPRAHNILATPSPKNFIIHHKIAHELRSLHWWSADECKYPVPLSLAEKLKEWCFSDSVE
ncbi:MAG: DUF3962 domain-containing protein [Crocosphaera sp.]|nr:DUF3962 domain-containing protein [Crocosphaera sp.]